MKDGKDNSLDIYQCPLHKVWDATQNNINETHFMVTELTEHTKHLPIIAETLKDIKENWMNAATGKDHVPTKVMNRIVNIMGSVVLGLTTIIGFLLVGSHFGWIPPLHQ